MQPFQQPKDDRFSQELGNNDNSLSFIHQESTFVVLCSSSGSESSALHTLHATRVARHGSPFGPPLVAWLVCLGPRMLGSSAPKSSTTQWPGCFFGVLRQHMARRSLHGEPVGHGGGRRWSSLALLSAGRPKDGPRVHGIFWFHFTTNQQRLKGPNLPIP